MADEIHPTQPLIPTTTVDVPAEEKRGDKQHESDENHGKDKENNTAKRPPKSGIIDEYV